MTPGAYALFPKAAFDTVVIAASAGGIAALRAVFTALPVDFPSPILVVQHLSPRYPTQLVGVMQFNTRLPVMFAADGARLRGGTVYLAPPDLHMSIGADRRIVLDESQKVNYCRPSGDPLFLSAAALFGSRVLGVVLTGMGRDGATGAATIRAAGGTVIVQEPASAEAQGMPRAALAARAAHFVLPLASIAPAIVSLVMVPGAAGLFGVGEAA